MSFLGILLCVLINVLFNCHNIGFVVTFRSHNILKALYLSPPLQDYHGLHYNRCETSEDEEKEADWAQRMFVGVANETASTCNSL